MRNFRKVIFIVFMLLFFVAPAFAQDGFVLDSRPEWMDYSIEMATILIPAVLVGMGIVFLGVSVPPGYIEKQRIQAKSTDTPIDDIVWEVIAQLNAIQEKAAIRDEKAIIFSVGNVEGPEFFREVELKAGVSYVLSVEADVEAIVSIVKGEGDNQTVYFAEKLKPNQWMVDSPPSDGIYQLRVNHAGESAIVWNSIILREV